MEGVCACGGDGGGESLQGIIPAAGIAISLLR